jgi:NADH-quinone oxidoreductase subunit J
MTLDAIVFYILAAVCLLAAIGVVVSRNPVHAAVFVVITFFNVAAIFVMLGAEFLAAVQVIVYAGAMLVLVLFTIMLVDPDNLPELHAGRPVQRIVGVLLGLILLLEVGLAIINRAFIGPGGNATPELIALVGGPAQAMGYILYNQYALPFEVVSLVLLVGVIGAIVLALPERLGEQFGLRRGTISLGHPRGTEVALPTGPDGEAPITPADRKETEALEGTRELILVRDPDKFTTLGERR